MKTTHEVKVTPAGSIMCPTCEGTDIRPTRLTAYKGVGKFEESRFFSVSSKGRVRDGSAEHENTPVGMGDSIAISFRCAKCDKVESRLCIAETAPTGGTEIFWKLK